jgi:hypothetical protein
MARPIVALLRLLCSLLAPAPASCCRSGTEQPSAAERASIAPAPTSLLGSWFTEARKEEELPCIVVVEAPMKHQGIAGAQIESTRNRGEEHGDSLLTW